MGEGGKEGGIEEGRKGERRKKEGRVGVGRGGWEGTLRMNVPLSGNTIFRFFEILKTVVEGQSNKSVMTSVSRPLHKLKLNSVWYIVFLLGWLF